jgi:hypothetical protein
VSNNPYVVKKLLPNVEGDIEADIVKVQGVTLGLKGYESS